jgi:hypothetical protein
VGPVANRRPIADPPPKPRDQDFPSAIFYFLLATKSKKLTSTIKNID